ncbi:MAG: PAS domain-containing protein [bacterium]|nr:PAS domain-containing protein [bacterium]
MARFFRQPPARRPDFMLPAVMPQRPFSPLIAYGLPVLLTLVAFGLSLLFYPAIAPNPYLLFWGAVALSASLWGFRAGLLAAGLTMIIVEYFFYEPRYAIVFDATDVLRLTMFVGVALLISRLSASNQSATRRAQQQQEWFRITLSSIGDAVIATDTEGRISFINGVAETLTGWSAAEAVGTPIDKVFRIVNATTRQPRDNPLLEALKKGTIVGLANHTILIAKDGREIHISDSGAPIRDDRGQILGAVLVFRDVSEEREAARIGEMAEIVLNNVSEGFTIFDTDWRHVFVNPAAIRLTDAARGNNEPLVGQTIEEAFPALKESTLYRLLQQAALDRQPRFVEEHIEFYQRWYLYRIYPLSFGVAVFTEEITERKRAQLEAEEARAEAEAARRTLHNLFMEAPALIGILRGREGRVELFNPRFTQLWGNRNVLGKTMREAFHELEGQGWFEIMERVYNTGEPIIGTEQRADFDQNNDGKLETSYFNFVYQATRNSKGEVDGVAIYGVDVTNLVLARDKAQEADRLKLQFLGMISHELRTPLASIKGFSSTLLMEDVNFAPDQQREFTRVIDQEADKLTDLVEQLLDLSRMQAGTMTVHPQAAGIERVLDEARFQLDMLTQQHQLRIDLEPRLAYVMIDVQRIAQVLVNLVSNAAKFSPPNSEILVEVHRADQWVEVVVCDHGIGIPPEDRLQVFEAFRQVERKISGAKRGAGLGLAICRGIVEAHGGRIWIAENDAPGTKIVFTLPLATSTNADQTG